MKVYESGLALLDTEIRTEVTLIYGWARQLGHDRRHAVVNTLPIWATDELIPVILSFTASILVSLVMSTSGPNIQKCPKSKQSLQFLDS
jgi:hypothetical protein